MNYNIIYTSTILFGIAIALCIYTHYYRSKSPFISLLVILLIISVAHYLHNVLCTSVEAFDESTGESNLSGIETSLDKILEELSTMSEAVADISNKMNSLNDDGVDDANVDG